MSNFSVSYDGTLEDVNNQFLVTNILRATDHAPLYFSTLSDIKGALSANIGETLSAPVGEGKITSTKHFVLGASAGLSANPTFDVLPLNEQDFTKGILQPLELQYGKLYWDRTDYPEFVLALLFVDKIEVRYFRNGRQVTLLDNAGNDRPCALQTGCTAEDLRLAGIARQPCPAIAGCMLQDPRLVETYYNDPEIPDEFAAFLQVIGSGRLGPGWGVVPGNPRNARSVIYHGYRELAAGTSETASRSAADATASGFFRLTAAEDQPKSDKIGRKEDRLRIIICPPKSFLDFWSGLNVMIIAPQIVDTGLDAGPQNANACDRAELPAEENSARALAGARATMEITIYTRSVEGIIQYLGKIVRAYGDSPENPIRFYIRPGPIAGEKIAVEYDGKVYAVGPYTDDSRHTLGADNTLPILGLVGELLNLRKSAKEITSAPTAVIVP